MLMLLFGFVQASAVKPGVFFTYFTAQQQMKVLNPWFSGLGL
jgi:hypothetical protein